MTVLKLILLLFLLLEYKVNSKEEIEIDELDILLDVLANSGNNARVGILSESNYYSTKRILPSNTRPIIIEHEEDLTQMVLNGSLIAALVSGLPEERYHDSLHIFSSSIVTMHSILMAPDKSTDRPHGTYDDLSTKDLSIAINAAITRIQSKRIDDKLAEKNHPKELVHAYTCKDDDANQFALPNKNEATGLLKDVIEKKKLIVLANGPYNWGDNDGNYLVQPPVGFYVDFLDAIAEEFKNLSGPDKVLYGEIKIERFYTKDSAFPWYKLFDGSTHITEPYFILDAAYGGSGKRCNSDNDCLDSDLFTGKEICRSSNTCYHPPRPRIEMLRSSCTAVATDSKFFTKRNNRKEIVKQVTSLNSGVIISLVILSLVCVITLSFIGILFYKKKVTNKSSFTKLFE